MPTPRENTGITIGIIFTMISSGMIFARLYTGIVLVKRSGVEEIIIAFAWLFCLANFILIIVGIENGLSRHLGHFDLQQQKRILVPFYASISMYTISLALSKAAIILIYMRIFPSQRFAIYCWITMVALVIFMLWGCFGFMLICHPIALLWDKSLTGVCIDGRIPYFSASAFNIFTDFVVFGLPLPILWKLQITKKQSILIIVFFGLGLTGSLTCILRLKGLYNLSVSTNYTYSMLEAAIWSLAETNIGVICACAPTLKPFITAFLLHFASEKQVRKISPTAEQAIASPQAPPSQGLPTQCPEAELETFGTGLAVPSRYGKKPQQDIYRPFPPSLNMDPNFDIGRQSETNGPRPQQGITVTMSVTRVVRNVGTNNDISSDHARDECDGASTRGLRMK